MIQFITKLLYITKEDRKSLLVMIFLFLFISLLEVFGIGIVGPFIAIAIKPELIKDNYWLNLTYSQMKFRSEQEFMICIGILIITVFFFKAFFSFNAQKSVFKFSNNLKANLSCKLLNEYIEAPYSYHLRINSATLIQSITNTTDTISIGLVSTLLTFICNSIIVSSLMILLIKTNAIALIFIFLLLIISFGVIHPLKRHLSRWSKEGYNAYGEMIRVTNHGLGGLKETRIIGCESYFENQMQEQSRIFAKATALASAYGNLPRFVLEPLMISFLIGFTLLFMITDRDNSQNLAGVLSIFAFASVRLLPAVGSLVSGINVIRTSSYSLDKIFFNLKELEKERSIADTDCTYFCSNLSPHQKHQKFPFSDKISLQGLVFQYPQATRKILDNVSLTVKRGESIGIIGKSGAGKTTLVDVLLGLFTPQVGDIKVDGISVYSNLSAWQNMLGYVPQSIFLIDDTLERNIAFGVPDDSIDRHRLNKAIEMSQLEDVVKQLPDGIQTIVGERGVLLSGGQRQRVGIARVLYHQREILVFDEATAALDNETEQLVTEATKALSGSRTIIIIAHRLSTIEHCDCIYQIDRGKIIQSGSYQQVVLGGAKNTATAREL
jgi:ATP-binding cassette, subfamily B, bacterial PglK